MTNEALAHVDPLILQQFQSVGEANAARNTRWRSARRSRFLARNDIYYLLLLLLLFVVGTLLAKARVLARLIAAGVIERAFLTCGDSNDERRTTTTTTTTTDRHKACVTGRRVCSRFEFGIGRRLASLLLQLTAPAATSGIVLWSILVAHLHIHQSHARSSICINKPAMVYLSTTASSAKLPISAEARIVVGSNHLCRPPAKYTVIVIIIIIIIIVINWPNPPLISQSYNSLTLSSNDVPLIYFMHASAALRS
jgi:hypothetical protein